MIYTYENFPFEGVEIDLHLKLKYNDGAVSFLPIGATYKTRSGDEKAVPWADMADVVLDFDDMAKSRPLDRRIEEMACSFLLSIPVQREKKSRGLFSRVLGTLSNKAS